MNIENAIGVSYSRRAEMAGDHCKIRNVLELNIRAEAIGDGASATGGIVAGKESSAFEGFYQEISINGASFGSGYISNITADPEGTDVQKKTYTVTATITKEGDLDQFLPSVSKEISKHIDSISENYSEQQSSHRRIITHTCSIKTNAEEVPDLDGVLEGILDDTNHLESLFDIDKKQVYRFKNYSYDDKSQSYNYEQTREWVENELSDASNIVISQGSFEYNNGIINATFSVEVTGIQGDTVEDRSESALRKASSFLDNKAADLFSSYSDFVIGSIEPLKEIKTNQTIIFNRNEAKCSITVTYSNSLDIPDGGLVYWEYSTEEQKLADEIITSEQGRVIGGGVIREINETSGSSEKYTNADAFFESECSKSAAKNRAGGSGRCISESISRGYGEGIISYRYSFSDNKSLLFQDDDGGEAKERKKITSTNKQDPLFLHSTFLIPELKELLQKQDNVLPNLKINRTTITTNSACNISDFISNLFLASETQIIDSMSVRFSPKKREASCETTYYEILN